MEEQVYRLETSIAHRIRASQSLTSPILGLIPRGELIYGSTPISGSNGEKWVLLSKKTMLDFSESQAIGWTLHTASDSTCYLYDSNAPSEDKTYVIKTPVAHRVRADKSLKSAIIGLLVDGQEVHGSEPITNSLGEKWISLSKGTVQTVSQDHTSGWTLHTDKNGRSFVHMETNEETTNEETGTVLTDDNSSPTISTFKWLMLLHLVVGW